MGLLKTGRRRWGLFAVCIAAPALGLAVLGLRTVNLEQVERRAQIEQQQAQTELLADARIADRLIQLDRVPAAGGIPFELNASGTLIFPHDRMYFAEAGAEPAEERTALPDSLATLAEEALAAEAQSNFERAGEICRRLTGEPRLAAWAHLLLARMDLRSRPRHFLQWASGFAAGDWDARAPDGEPVMLIGADHVRDLPAPLAAQCRPFVTATLAELRGGRWWLSYQERRLRDTELRDTLAAMGVPRPTDDPLLAEAGDIERIVRRATPFPRDGQARLYRRERADAYLLVTSPRPGSANAWSGTALATDSLSGLLQRSLDPIKNNVSYPLALTDSSKRVLWGAPVGGGPQRSFPLRSVGGWELRSGQPLPGIGSRRFLWYAFVAFLFLMLAFGIVVTMRTARREMELARLHDEFAASVTHEFKSPITGIRLLMERILSGRAGNHSTMQDYYIAVCRETDRLELLVNRLLETHRIQCGQVQYHFAPQCTADLAETAIARLRPQGEAKRIALTLKTDDAMREVEMDHTAMQDSIENLIENAIKYSPPETLVEVVVEHTAAEVRVTVRDQGVGIDPADLPRIFNRFFRGRRDDQQSVRGTGLGLPLVKAVAEGHGGSVAVTSTPGKGSEFCLRIPIREEKALCPKL